MTESKVDVEQIMTQIRSTIQKEGLKDDMLSFLDIPMPAQVTVADEGEGPFDKVNFMDANKEMNRSYTVSVWHPASGNKAKQFIKKAVRKTIKMVLEPIVSDQNRFNLAVAKSVNELRNYIFYGVNGENIDDQIEALMKRVDALEQENKILKERLYSQEK